MRKLFSHDPVAGRSQYWHYDAASDTAIIESVQNVAPIIELTQAEFNAIDERAPWKGDLHHIGRIPLNEVDELMRRGIWQSDKALARWLNDRDNGKFRTRPGTV